MSRVVVCTAHDAPYKELANVTLPSLRAYCARHGYHLEYQDNIPPEEKDLCKARIYFDLARSGQFGREDLFLWVDSDALVMNQSIRVEEVFARFCDASQHFLWAYNWDGPNSGVFIARFSDEAANYMRVYSYEQAAMGWGDNNAMNQKMLYPPFRDWVKLIPGKHMNAAPWDLYGMGHMAHKDTINNYEPGDWILHLPGMESGRRMELLRGYAAQIAAAPIAPSVVVTNPDAFGAPHPLGENGPVDWPKLRGLEAAMRLPRKQDECTDWALWHAVFKNNEYGIEAFNPDDVVIDVGASTGPFSCLAYCMGSRNVHAYEMDGGSYAVARMNIAALNAGDHVTITHAAVVGQRDGKALSYIPGSMHVNREGRGEPVEPITMSEILAPYNTVRLLKIDIEGGEWDVFFNTPDEQWAKVQAIKGEYHHWGENRVYDADTLKTWLDAHGFKSEIIRKDSIGDFSAWR